MTTDNDMTDKLLLMSKILSSRSKNHGAAHFFYLAHWHDWNPQLCKGLSEVFSRLAFLGLMEPFYAQNNNKPKYELDGGCEMDREKIILSTSNLNNKLYSDTTY